MIGGYAVGYHGYPRATNDMDIWIAIDPENAELMVLALNEFGFDTPQLSKNLFLKKNSIVRMGNAPMRIEILTTISGVNFEERFQQSFLSESVTEKRNLMLTCVITWRAKDGRLW